MKKTTSRISSFVTALAISVSILSTNISLTSEAATWNDINQSGVFLKQEFSDSCTACAATMLIRRVALMRGDEDWYTITEAEVRDACDWNSVGLGWDFTVRGIRLLHTYDLPSGYDAKANALRDMLSRCPEGLVVYDEDWTSSYSAHAILLTDFTDGQFYCCDPAGSVPAGRIPLSSSLVSLESIDGVWWTESPIVSLEPDKKTPSKPSISVKAGTSNINDATVISCNNCSDTTHYDFRIYRKGEAEPFVFEGVSSPSYSINLPVGTYSCNIASVNSNYGTYTFSDSIDFTVEAGRIEPYKITTYNGHIYASYTNNLMYHDEAKDFCEKASGHLATITSKAENDVIASILPSNSDQFWLGASDSSEEGVWSWCNGESFNYANFAEGQPDDADNEDYLTIWGKASQDNSAKWNDSKGELRRMRGFILEVEPLTEVATAERDGSIYKLFDASLNWNEAFKYAELLQGQLVSINDEAEHNFIHEFIQQGNKQLYWLGLKRTDSDSTFKWLDGSTGMMKWAETQPDFFKNREFFGEMYKDSGLINDESNYYEGNEGFIVEIKRDITDVTLIGPPDKSVYVIGEELDLSGCSLKVSYDKGNSQIINKNDGLTGSADLSSPGQKELSLTYNGKTVTHPITVIEKADVNTDGNINISDAVMLQSWLLGRTKTLSNWKAADLCEDDRIDVFDMVLLRQLLVERMYTEWSDELPPEGAVVEERVEYRVAQKEFKETEEKLDSSWTLEDKSTIYEWSPYSEYSTTEVKESDTCKVISKTEEVDQLVGWNMYYKCVRDPYNYTRWYCADSLPTGYDEGYGVHSSELWGTGWVASQSELNSGTLVPVNGTFNGGMPGINKADREGYYIPSHPDVLWYKGSAVYSKSTVKYYSYSTRTTKTLYKYSKVGEFSEWTTEKPSEAESENAVIETRTVYRYINK